MLVVAHGRGQARLDRRLQGSQGTHLLGDGRRSEAGDPPAQSCEEGLSSGGAATPAPWVPACGDPAVPLEGLLPGAAETPPTCQPEAPAAALLPLAWWVPPASLAQLPAPSP